MDQSELRLVRDIKTELEFQTSGVWGVQIGEPIVIFRYWPNPDGSGAPREMAIADWLFGVLGKDTIIKRLSDWSQFVEH